MTCISGDRGNPLLCAEYVNEMYDIFKSSERQFQISPDYFSKQPHINESMRTILVDWLVEVIPTDTHVLLCLIRR